MKNPYDSYVDYRLREIARGGGYLEAARRMTGEAARRTRSNVTALGQRMRVVGAPETLISAGEEANEAGFRRTSTELLETGIQAEEERKRGLQPGLQEAILKRDVYQEQLDEQARQKKEARGKGIFQAAATGVGAITSTLMGAGPMVGAKAGAAVGDIGASFMGEFDPNLLISGATNAVQAYGSITGLKKHKEFAGLLGEKLQMAGGMSLEGLEAFKSGLMFLPDTESKINFLKNWDMEKYMPLLTEA